MEKQKVCDRISYPETSFESLADYIQCNRVDARVEGCHVDAKIVQDKKNTEKGGHMLGIHETKVHKSGNEGRGNMLYEGHVYTLNSLH